MARIIIVGGGASGLAAALSAAERHDSVTVLERTDRVGKKILVTGNGRCNLSNRTILPECYVTSSPGLLPAYLSQMPENLLRGFLERLGLLTAEDGTSGRIYPGSFQAGTVLDTLRLALVRRNVKVETGVRVTEIVPQAGGFTVQAGQEKRTADRVVLACGGCADPARGTDGSGYRLAESLGHTVRPLFPCLVPLRCDGTGALKGVRVRAEAALYRDGRELGRESGEIQMTGNGLSGIPVMDLSCLLGTECAGAEISLDLFPRFRREELLRVLEARAASAPDQTMEELMTGLLHKAIASAVMKSCGIRRTDRVHRLAELAGTCKDWRFPVRGTLGWERAQTTGGGVPLTEAEPETMASRRVPGLYLTGELLDAAGKCGGYNLHWAFCTGILAGRAV